MRRVLSLACLPLFLVAVGCTNKGPSQSQAGSSHLARAVLGAIRQPREGQFPDPRSVVEFLVEQVRKQDIDEALRAFPIAETLKGETFTESARTMKVFVPDTSPLPAPCFHNLSRALGRPVMEIHRLSLALLGVDPGMHFTIPSQESVKEFESRLDTSKLRGAKISRFNIIERGARSRGDLTSPQVLMGITEIQGAEFEIECSGNVVACDAFVGHISGNWRILSLSVRGLREARE